MRNDTSVASVENFPAFHSRRIQKKGPKPRRAVRCWCTEVTKDLEVMPSVPLPVWPPAPLGWQGRRRHHDGHQTTAPPREDNERQVLYVQRDIDAHSLVECEHTPAHATASRFLSLTMQPRSVVCDINFVHALLCSHHYRHRCPYVSQLLTNNIFNRDIIVFVTQCNLKHPAQQMLVRSLLDIESVLSKAFFVFPDHGPCLGSHGSKGLNVSFVVVSPSFSQLHAAAVAYHQSISQCTLVTVLTLWMPPAN